MVLVEVGRAQRGKTTSSLWGAAEEDRRHKVLSVGGGLSVASANCCPEVQEVSAGIPEQRFPTMGALPCVPRDASLPGACMGMSGPCLWLTCSVGGLRAVGKGGPPDLALWVCFPAELLL